MTSTKEKQDELLDELLKGCDSPEGGWGEGGGGGGEREMRE